MAERNMKRCLMPLTIMKMQVKATVSHHLTSVRRAFIKSQETTAVDEDAGKREPLCTTGGNTENGTKVPQKIKSKTTVGSSNVTPGSVSKGN